MKPLDREPSDGAEPQRVLGDCATLGTIALPNFRPALRTPVETRLTATLAAVTRFSEWPSHLANTVGAHKGGLSASASWDATELHTPRSAWLASRCASAYNPSGPESLIVQTASSIVRKNHGSVREKGGRDSSWKSPSWRTGIGGIGAKVFRRYPHRMRPVARERVRSSNVDVQW